VSLGGRSPLIVRRCTAPFDQLLGRTLAAQARLVLAEKLTHRLLGDGALATRRAGGQVLIDQLPLGVAERTLGVRRHERMNDRTLRH
jgi:hypothetical protein